MLQTFGEHRKPEARAIFRAVNGRIIRQQHGAVVMKMLVLHLQNPALKRRQLERVRLGSDFLEGGGVVAARDVDGHYDFLFLGLRRMLGKLIVHSPSGSDGGIYSSPFESSLPLRCVPAE